MANEPGSMLRDLTNGSVAKQLITFAMPLFLSNLLQVVYNMADMVVIGRFVGSAGLSAVAIGGDVMHFLDFLVMGFAVAGQVIISQYVGAGQREKISRLIGTMLSFLLICAVVMSAFCFVFSKSILSWLSTPDAAWDYAHSYIVTCTAGLIFTYGYNSVSAILRGMGDSKRPFYFITISALLNIILDLLFVAVFRWAAFGAALATVIGQSVSFLCSIVYLYKRREEFGFDFKLRSFYINRSVLIPLVKLGVPMAIQSASIQISKLFTNSWINSYGVVVSAVTGIGTKLGTICNLCTNAIMTGASAMIGQNIGAAKYKRVSHIVGTSYIMALIVAVLLSGVVLIFPTQLFAAFTDEAEVLELSLSYIPIIILIFFGNAVRTPNNALINGSGNSRLNLFVALLDGVVARIGLGLLLGLAYAMGYYGFWLGNALSGYVPFVIGAIYFVSGKWRSNKYIT